MPGGKHMQTILIVEDDWEMNQGISYVLREEGYRTVSAHSMAEGRDVYEDNGADLILLDVNLPDGDGFEFCRWIRERSKVSVFFLTARDLEEDTLLGYELGAEDYVTKPFSMKILLRKISVILKRSGEEQVTTFDDGFLKIDLIRAKQSSAAWCVLSLPTEFRILKGFLAHRGQLFTYEVLLDRLWDGGNQFVDKHALAVNINRLRGKNRGIRLIGGLIVVQELYIQFHDRKQKGRKR